MPIKGGVNQLVTDVSILLGAMVLLGTVFEPMSWSTLGLLLHYCSALNH